MVGIHSEEQLLIRLLRAIRGSSQEEMGAATSIDRTTISRYETGDMSPSRQQLARLAEAAGLSLPFAESVLLPVVQLVRTPAASTRRPASPGSGRATAEIETSLVGTVRSGIAELLSELTARDTDAQQAPPASDDRLGVAALWARFQSYGPCEQRRWIEQSSELQTWAFSEKLCEESAKAAAGSAEQSLHLAKLGLRAAKGPSGHANRHACGQGYSWAFIGNALRVAGDLRAADAAFAMAGIFWRQGAPECQIPLAEWRIFDLEASLRREQRRWSEALDLLDRAGNAAPIETAGRILVKKATVLEHAGDVAAALATLDTAERLINAAEEPRLRWLVQFNRLVCFCHLERYQEAAAQLSEAGLQVVALNHDLDLLRLVWLKGRIAAGQGHRQEALNCFERVRAEFTARKDIYHAAVVSLELAVVYRQQERFGDVRDLAGSIAHIFESQHVHRETLAALRLFYEASEAQAATDANG
jgi:tetratricopeptide (TPR) repeat protein/DNA-binding XRE family transcriptional regulator